MMMVINLCVPKQQQQSEMFIALGTYLQWLQIFPSVFNEIFSGYQIPSDDNQDGPWNIGSIQSPDLADSLRRFHQI
jgi:hypothetical protein